MLHLLPTRALSIYSAFFTVSVDELPALSSKANLLLISRFRPFLLTQGHRSSNFLPFLHHQFFLLLEHSHQHKNMLLFLHCKKQSKTLGLTKLPTAALLLGLPLQQTY